MPSVLGNPLLSSSRLAELEARVDALVASSDVPLSSPENFVLLGTGDGSNLTFSFPYNDVSRVDGVYVDGLPQSSSIWSFTASTLTFSVGNAPPNGKTVEVVAFRTA